MRRRQMTTICRQLHCGFIFSYLFMLPVTLQCGEMLSNVARKFHKIYNKAPILNHYQLCHKQQKHKTNSKNTNKNSNSSSSSSSNDSLHDSYKHFTSNSTQKTREEKQMMQQNLTPPGAEVERSNKETW